MLAGVIKAAPIAALLGALSARDVLAYAGLVATLSGVVVVGALWAAAKAWRERAEARTDEADQRGEELVTAKEHRIKLETRIAVLESELRNRPDIGDAFQEILRALTRNANAIEFLAKNVDWPDIIERHKKKDA